MKQRIASLLLAGAVSLSMLSMSALAAEGTFNFHRRLTYTPGQFTDVAADDWFADSVGSAWELGLMKGSSKTGFVPEGTLTWAQALALACRLHSMYYTGLNIFEQEEPWYQVYVDYALEHGLLDGPRPDWNAVISRGEFACLMARTMPASVLPAINTVEDHAIPDVPCDSPLAGPVYLLYRAGVLTGLDEAGRFGPDESISRAAVAAVVTRMADARQRQSVTLTAVPLTLYAPDGRSRTAYWDQHSGLLAEGWYDQPVTILYAEDGRSTVVAAEEAAVYEALGWHRDREETFTVLYSLSGCELKVLKAEVPAYRQVGWYPYPELLCARADQVAGEQGYSAAVDYVDGCLKGVSPADPIYSPLMDKRARLLNDWSWAIGSPVSLEGVSVDRNSIGTPQVSITLRNLAPAALTSFEVSWTCLDAYGNATTDWPGLYDGTVHFHGDYINAAPGQTFTRSWSLFSNELTTQIRDLRLYHCIFADGTQWGAAGTN